MLTRIWAAVRTTYLLFVTGYTLWAMPWVTLQDNRTCEMRSAESIGQLRKAVWLAIAWIALETLMGWWTVWRATKAKGTAGGELGGSPPKAP